MTNFKKHNQKAKRIQKQIDKIKAKYPDVPVTSLKLKNDIVKLHELITQNIYEEIDAAYCKSDNPNKMCSDCNCWKATRRNCM